MAKGGEKRGGEAHKSIYTANYILILCQELAVTLFVKILSLQMYLFECDTVTPTESATG